MFSKKKFICQREREPPTPRIRQCACLLIIKCTIFLTSQKKTLQPNASYNSIFQAKNLSKVCNIENTFQSTSLCVFIRQSYNCMHAYSSQTRRLTYSVFKAYMQFEVKLDWKKILNLCHEYALVSGEASRENQNGHCQ